MPTCEIYVVGSYGVAFWIVGDVPAPGETLLGSGFAFGHGGKGSNQAIGAARLGATCKLLAGVGIDKFGDEALQLWRAEGVDCSAVRQMAETPTMAGIIILDAEGENRIITDPGANARLTATDVDTFAATWKSPGILLTQLEIPAETAARALTIGKARGLTTILNPAPARALPKEIFANVDILTPNQSEARILLGLDADDRQADADLAARLRGLGVEHVVMTLGTDGALIAGPDGQTKIASYPVDVVDTTGAGDAFNGALAAGLASGLTLADAVRRGTAAGALAVTKKLVVPALPDENQISKLIKTGPLAYED
ncbi:MULTISPECIES: ribokinase [unclassified Mesorhizobium]|uniref:ribokinase n=1 Tax=unclassified Mesorhizobium TaxID=325217 RepID=UPI00333766F2